MKIVNFKPQKLVENESIITKADKSNTVVIIKRL